MQTKVEAHLSSKLNRIKPDQYTIVTTTNVFKSQVNVNATCLFETPELFTYPNLNKEIPHVFFELWDILVETEQTFYEDLDLGTEKKEHLTYHNVHTQNCHIAATMYITSLFSPQQPWDF